MARGPRSYEDSTGRRSRDTPPEFKLPTGCLPDTGFVVSDEAAAGVAFLRGKRTALPLVLRALLRTVAC